VAFPATIIITPTEILIQILQYLDLFSFQLTRKYLDHLICDSVVLQYNVALDAAMTW